MAKWLVDTSRWTGWTWTVRVSVGAGMKKLVKGVHAIIQNDDGTGTVFVKKFPRLGWFIVKTRRGVTVYDGGDEKAAARAIVEHQQKSKAMK